MKILFEFDVQIRFDPHDLWVGVYWKRDIYPHSIAPHVAKHDRVSTTLFICPLPMIVIRIRRDKYGRV